MSDTKNTKKPISKTDILQLISEEAFIITRKTALAKEIHKIETELKHLNENVGIAGNGLGRGTVGSFGFKADGDGHTKNHSGFVNKMDISHINQLAKDFGMDKEEFNSENGFGDEVTPVHTADKSLEEENAMLKKELAELKTGENNLKEGLMSFLRGDNEKKNQEPSSKPEPEYVPEIIEAPGSDFYAKSRNDWGKIRWVAIQNGHQGKKPGSGGKAGILGYSRYPVIEELKDGKFVMSIDPGFYKKSKFDSDEEGIKTIKADSIQKLLLYLTKENKAQDNADFKINPRSKYNPEKPYDEEITEGMLKKPLTLSADIKKTQTTVKTKK